MLTLHQLKVFVTVAESGSVRAAADRLVVTQPAVSASLAALERSVCATLVARAGRGIELTEAGRVMLRYARQLLGLVDEAVTSVSGLDAAGAGAVRVGVTTAAAHHLVATLLAHLRDRRPGLRLELELGNTRRIWQLLADRSIDAAVAGRPPASNALVSVATRPNQLVLVAKPGAVWANRLAETTWLLREPGSATRAAVEEVIAGLGIAPPVMTIGSSAAIQSSAEAGLGVALLPRDAVEAALRTRALTIVHARLTPLDRPWHVVVRAGELLPAAAREFVDGLTEADAGFVRV